MTDTILRFTITVAPGVTLHLRRHPFLVTATLVADTVPLCFAQARLESVRFEHGHLACLYLDTTVFVLPGDQLAEGAKCLSLPLTNGPRA